MVRKLFALSLFVLLCSLLYVRFNLVEVESSNGYPVAPDFILTDIDGNSFSLSDYQDRVVLVDFFHTNCTLSVNQFSELVNLHEDFGEKLVLISISPENETILRDLRATYSINWTIARDTSNVFDMYSVSCMPTLVTIDQYGYIRYTHVGLTAESVLRPEIESLLPKIIYVDDDNIAGPWNGTEEHPYQNITNGLEHASDNDTVFVQNGTYCEHVVVNKSISLIGGGSSTTIIDGEGTGSVIYVFSDDVTIMGFTVQNSGRLINGTVPDAGISTSHASDLNVSGNLLTDNYVSIFARPSKNTWFTNNVITHNHIGIDINNQSTHNIMSGNSLKENNVSIHIYYADSNVFFQNNLTDNPVGVIVRYSCDNAFSENEIRNGLNGMILNGADFNNISKNIMSDLEYGIQLKAYADHNFICENSITNCSYAGIDLDEYVCDNSLSNNTIVGSEVGIDISNWSVNNTISGNTITNNWHGIAGFNGSSNNSIFGNNVTYNGYGIYLRYSSNNNNISENAIVANTQDGLYLGWCSQNTLFRNDITNNYRGIFLAHSPDNTFSEHKIANNDVGVHLTNSSNNRFYHINFIGNLQQVYDSSWDDPYWPPSTNVWDDGYPSGGNYWSNYTGVDSDHNGIGDTEYVLDANNTDNYPLVGIFSSFNTSLGKHVNIVSNSTVQSFKYLEANSTIRIYVSYESPLEIITFGFCRVCIPYKLMNVTNIHVRIDDGATAVLYPNYTLHDNTTHRWIYFAYEHSTHKINVIPEFPTLIILLLFMTATLLAVIVYKKRPSLTDFYKR